MCKLYLVLCTFVDAVVVVVKIEYKLKETCNCIKSVVYYSSSTLFLFK